MQWIHNSFSFTYEFENIECIFAKDGWYKNYKWVLTNKLKQGDIVKSVDYKIYKSLCVFDKRDRFGMSWCWEIYNKRPKEIRCDEYMYKLVERE
jgi:hypothetical protein